MMTYRYRHFGLTLASALELPGLPSATLGPSDITLEFVRANTAPSVEPPWEMVDPPRTAWRTRGNFGSLLRLQFHGRDGEWAEFVIDERGERVEVMFGPGVDLGELVQLLVGSPFSCILAQRGATCLHASVVEHRGRAIAFVGAKRSGKSTLALACVEQGARLVSDDVGSISLRDDVVSVAVGSPSLRIAAGTASLIPDDELRPIWAGEENRPDKRYRDIRQTDCVGEVSLSGIYVLAPREAREPAARSLTPRELLPRLIGERHMAEFLDPEGHRRDFACLATLVERVPGHELERPNDLASISIVARYVLR